MRIKLDPWGKLPTRAHSTDAGYDLYAPERVVVPARGSVTINTGVHVQLPHGTAGIIISKSGLNIKHNITSTGLIDQGYTGAIHIKLYNHGTTDYTVEAGDRISQLAIVHIMTTSLEVVDELAPTDRGDGGLGSTGK